MTSLWRHARVETVATMLVLAGAVRLDAQPPASAPAEVRDGATTQAPVARIPRWEVEGHGAWFKAGTPTIAFPGPGASLTTSSPLFPTRQTPSWFFGDGAAILNSVNEQFGLSDRISSLDSPIEALVHGNSSGGVIGVRVRRILTSRFSAEVGVDFLGGSGFTDEFTSEVEAARASFASAISGLLSTGPFTDQTVNATAGVRDGSSREVMVTGALNVLIGGWQSFRPYATFGGGVLTGTGDLPAAALEGSYGFSILAEVPIHETDRATIRYSHGTSVVAVLGGGLRRDMSDRWGFRIDGRAYIGRPGTRILVDAEPAVTTGSPGGFVESFTNPSIQFSNDPSTGRLSTLSGPPLRGFELSSDDVQARLVLGVGVFARF
ncbi:MAG TPA: hypothetical protein VLD67_14550 [Vicinamibacterales bacterium]|nr:hypothetical protein [Vicinamibacterales bacterium]